MSDVFNFSVETSAATSDGEQSTVEHSMSPTNSDVVARIRQTRKTRRRIPNEKWEEKRPLITRLYQVERRSLNEVMQILKRDDWDPTVKMYKSRIWKWGLDKKLKSDEVLAILLLKQERDAQQKPSQFTIRGQPVDMDNINRYVKRNAGLLSRVRAGERPSVQSSHEVACYTPPPSPTRSLQPPGEMHRVDEVLFLFRDYVDGSFGNYDWQWEYDVSCVGRNPGDRSEELFERVMASFALVNRCLQRGDNISVSEILNPAFESLSEIVAAESPIFIVRTVCLLWYLDRHYQNNLLRVVMRYLGELVPVLLGKHHILARVWQTLSTTSFSDYYELSLRLYAMLVPLMEQRIGPANYLTTLLYADHVDCLFQRRQPSDSLAVVSRYRMKAEATGRRHPWLLEIAITQTAVMCSEKEADGRIDEARECLQNLKRYPMTEEQEAMVDIQMGNYSFRLNDIRTAIASYRRATRLAVTAGSDERLLTTCLTNLETALSKDGWIFDAKRVRDYRLRRIADFAAETSVYAKNHVTGAFTGATIPPMNPAPFPYTSQQPFPPAQYHSLPQAPAPSPTDDSWLWQGDLGGADLLKDLGPIDPGTRWMDVSAASVPWTPGITHGLSPDHQSRHHAPPVAPPHSADLHPHQYPTMAVLIPGAWEGDMYR